MSPLPVDIAELVTGLETLAVKAQALARELLEREAPANRGEEELLDASIRRALELLHPKPRMREEHTAHAKEEG